MAERIEYKLEITINKRKLTRVIIDQHYTENHPEMDDEIILELIKTINEETFEVEKEGNGFQYFKVEPVNLADKPYRLVLMLCIYDDFLGVINAFRVNKGKNDE
jgi:hypothetical protein